MNIINAIKDENLFRPFLGDELTTWRPWLTALRVLYGLPTQWTSRSRELIHQCTGRKVKHLPAEGFDTALFLTGRRCGKSRIAAIIGAYEAVLAGHESKLATGETGVVPIISPTKQQSQIVKKYLLSIFNSSHLLRHQVVSETREGFELRNGMRIEILAGDFRSVRGYTSVCCILDEVAFHQLDAESKVKSDTELIAAVEPSLATVGGKLIAISSPYARMGWCYDQWKMNFGNDAGSALVWNCPSRTMNPTLSQKYVDRKLAEDLQKAKSEFMGEFRDSVAAFISRAVVEKLVIAGRSRLLPQDGVQYHAFCDLSGGRNDAAALSIAHREGRMVVIDLAKQWKAPFNPHLIVSLMCDELRRFGLRRIVGDNFAASFVSDSFKAHGVGYIKSELAKSALYIELLPRLCSGEIQLPDDDVLVTQIASLERRTRSGGKDSIDHPTGGHDDLANAVAGVSYFTSKGRRMVGALA